MHFITLTLLYLYLLDVFLPLLSFYSFTESWMVSVLWTLGPVRFRQLASRPAPLTEDRYSATKPEPRKKASLLLNCLCYDVLLLWVYIIFQNNSSNGTGKNIYFLNFHYLYFFSLPPFSAPPADDGAPSICLYCLCPGLALKASYYFLHLSSSTSISPHQL